MSDPAHLLPPNATAGEVAQSRAAARLAALDPQSRQLWNPATCPASHLPWLAWALSVDEWDTAWSEAQKRAVIQASFQVHKHKGTVAAMRTALDALGYALELVEWFQESPPADPYTFALTATVEGSPIDTDLWAEIEAVALSAKNARSHLRAIRLRSGVRGACYIGGALMTAEIATVEPYHLTEITAQGTCHVGAAVIAYETITLYPSTLPGVPVLALTDGAPLAFTDGAPLRLLH